MLGCGVAEREGEELCCSRMPLAMGNMSEDGGVDRDGESKDMSSLIPDEDPCGRNDGGGVRPLSSVKVSQNSLPLELRIACCLKLLESPEVAVASAIMSSSGIPSKESCVGPKLGEECVVFVVDTEW